ncbi:MAG: nucleoside triphosphate pyrophosphohydrolase [Spirochaetes bacterium]|nr:nucleoside triphosphate pyrophosphohydrolase [Spirochaetota bacterium]
MKATEAFEALYNVVRKLRGPEGCPWDREQTPETLRKHLVEECYECIEAIDKKNPQHIGEELGDIFLLALMLSVLLEEREEMTVGDVLTGITEKLIRRHPHVFGDLRLKDSAEVLDNWAKIKVEQEGRKAKDSLLDDISSGLLPLERSFRIQEKAAKAGFDWPDTNGVVSKIHEEIEEVLESAVGVAHNSEKLEEELGDLLFSVVNLCRYLKTDPSLALRRTNSKFADRFKYVEKKMKETGWPMEKQNLEMMDAFWDEAKNSGL